MLDVAAALERSSKIFDNFERVTTDEDLKIIYSSLRTLNYFLSRSYVVSDNLLKEVNTLFNAIEKLPRKSEYDEVRDIVEKQKESVINTLIPIKEAFERSVEYENFGKKRTNNEKQK